MATQELAGPRGRSGRKPLARPAPPSTAAVSPRLAAGPTWGQQRRASPPQPAPPSLCPRSSAVLAAQRDPCTREEAARGLDPAAAAAITGQSPSRSGRTLVCKAAAPEPTEGLALIANAGAINSRSSDCPARPGGVEEAATPPRPHPGGLSSQTASVSAARPGSRPSLATRHHMCRWRTRAADPDLRRKMAAAA